LEDALEKISMVEEKLPDNQDLGYLLSSLTSLAKEPGVDFFRISCGDVKGGMEFSEIPVDINLSCRFLELGKYLEGLEKLDRLVNVKSFEIDLDQENIPKVKAKIKASVFVLQE
jgi:Tfp pilus assembly protein PilO